MCGESESDGFVCALQKRQVKNRIIASPIFFMGVRRIATLTIIQISAKINCFRYDAHLKLCQIHFDLVLDIVKIKWLRGSFHCDYQIFAWVKIVFTVIMEF